MQAPQQEKRNNPFKPPHQHPDKDPAALPARTRMRRTHKAVLAHKNHHTAATHGPQGQSHTLTTCPHTHSHTHNMRPTQRPTGSFTPMAKKKKAMPSRLDPHRGHPIGQSLANIAKAWHPYQHTSQPIAAAHGPPSHSPAPHSLTNSWPHPQFLTHTKVKPQPQSLAQKATAAFLPLDPHTGQPTPALHGSLSHSHTLRSLTSPQPTFTA